MNIRNKQKILILFILLFIITVIPIVAGIMLKEMPASAAKIKMIIRYDDVAANNYNENINSKKDIRKKEIELFEYVLRNHLKMSIGIIPFNENLNDTVSDEDSIRLINLINKGIENNIFEICLHGYTHNNNVNDISPGELTGIKLEEQISWLKKEKIKSAIYSESRLMF